jgi:hypothetical protein
LDITTAAVTLDVVNPLDDAVYILAAHTTSSLTGTQIALVKDVVPGLASWITGTFANCLVPGGQQEPNEDTDADGVDNLLEFVLNGFTLV